MKNQGRFPFLFSAFMARLWRSRMIYSGCCDTRILAFVRFLFWIIATYIHIYRNIVRPCDLNVFSRNITVFQALATWYAEEHLVYLYVLTGRRSTGNGLYCAWYSVQMPHGPSHGPSHQSVIVLFGAREPAPYPGVTGHMPFDMVTRFLADCMV